MHVARVAALLDDSGDDVALATAELAEDLLVLQVAQPLHDHLPRGGGGDPAETGRGVVEFGPGLALLVRLVGPDHDVAGLGVQLDARVLVGPVLAVVGHEQGLLDRGDQHGEGDLLSAPAPATPPCRCPSQPSSLPSASGGRGAAELHLHARRASSA